jgi:CSLREA domain-containing protein
MSFTTGGFTCTLRPIRVRPALVRLEGRIGPAVIIVNSIDDNTIDDAVVTLREAILSAN